MTQHSVLLMIETQTAFSRTVQTIPFPIVCRHIRTRDTVLETDGVIIQMNI